MAYYVHCHCHRSNPVIFMVVNLKRLMANTISPPKKIPSFLGTGIVHVRWQSARNGGGGGSKENGY